MSAPTSVDESKGDGGASAVVRTVRGDIDPATIGVTLMHEHLIVDYARNFAPPKAGTSRSTLGGLTPEQHLEMWEAPMSAQVAGHCRCYFSANRDNMILEDVDTIAAEVGRFRSLGGNTIVECSIEGIGRNPAALRDVSTKSGINVVMGTGFYLARVHPADMAKRTVEDLTALFVSEIQEGVAIDEEHGGGRVRAGLIGELGCTTDLQPTELKVLKAAAAAQAITGASISIHPGYSALAPNNILDVLAKAGADLSRVIMGHVDRGLLKLDHMLLLAARGCTLEFDQFGWGESFVHALAYDITYPSDFERVKMIKALIDAGYGKQIVISHDLAFKSRLVKYGGTGYDYINRNILPYMKKHGITDGDIRIIQEETPRRLLTLQPKPRAEADG